MYPTVSLIISTYNWVEALELCLKSVEKQTVLPNEVIIADDGSGEDTLDFIQKLESNFPTKIIHIWQEDVGFRLAQIRNKAIVASNCDYIIQIDGDIILETHFVEDHLRMAEERNFIAGSRVGLNEEVSRELLKGEKINLSPFSKGIDNRLNAIRFLSLTNYSKYRYKKHKPYYGRGCNMSFWRNDLLVVNGYNEAFKGWGKEDTELMVRLIKAGVRKQFIKFAGVAYHLYHKENSREREVENISLLEEIIKSNIIFSPKGLDQYL